MERKPIPRINVTSLQSPSLIEQVKQQAKFKGMQLQQFLHSTFISVDGFWRIVAISCAFYNFYPPKDGAMLILVPVGVTISLIKYPSYVVPISIMHYILFHSLVKSNKNL